MVAGTVGQLEQVAAIVPPERSRTQRLMALERANEVRTARAALKRDLRAGRRRPEDLLDHPECATMPIVELLLAMPKVGRVKANRCLTVMRISPSKRLAGLTQRQRGELVGWLRPMR